MSTLIRVKHKRVVTNNVQWLISGGNSYYEKFADGTVECIDEEIPFDVPQGWKWCRLNQICELIADCPHSTAPDEGDGYPLIRTPNVGFVELILEGAHRVCESTYNKRNERATPQEKDLIFAREAPAGNIAVIKAGEKVCLGQRTVLVRPFKAWVDSYYLAYYILAPTSQMNLVGQSTGTTVAHVNLADFRPFVVALPPLAEQQRIVGRLKSVLPFVEYYAHYKNQKDELDRSVFELLRKSILQEAITGKLVPQDSSEETATHLLNRVNDEKRKLLNEGKLNKREIVDSVVFKGEDNKYYETISGRDLEIELPFSFPESWAIVRLQSICVLMDGEKKVGDGLCLDAKYLRGKTSGDHLQSGKFVHKGDNIILVDGENSGEVFSVPIDGYMGSTFKKLWIAEALHTPYILACIRYYKKALRNAKKGAAIPHLDKELFKKLIIGIPPLKEQEQIIAQLNTISKHL